MNNKNKAIEEMIAVSEKYGLGLKDVMALSGKLNQYYKYKHTQQEDYTPKQYMDFEFVATAYQYILENGGKAEEALSYAADKLEKDYSFVEDAKNNKFFYTRNVVESHETHPKQKKMKKDKTMDKNYLNSSNTANQLTNRLSRAVYLQDQLDELRDTDTRQQIEIDKLKATTDTQEQNIQELQSVVGINTMTNKEKAIFLRKKGHTVKVIAENLGVSESSIKRWTKDLLK